MEKYSLYYAVWLLREVLSRETEEESSRDEVVGAMDELSNEDMKANQNLECQKEYDSLINHTP